MALWPQLALRMTWTSGYHDINQTGDRDAAKSLEYTFSILFSFLLTLTVSRH